MTGRVVTSELACYGEKRLRDPRQVRRRVAACLYNLRRVDAAWSGTYTPVGAGRGTIKGSSTVAVSTVWLR